MPRKLTKEKFIKKAKKTHNNKYDYSLVEYVNDKTKVKIICKKHGIFKQSPNVHYDHGCPLCANEHKKLTKEEFIKRSKEKHGDKFDYSLVKYKDIITKVKIICPVHGVFKQTPISNLKGGGCSKCSGMNQLTTKEFIKKVKEIHKNKFEYSLVKYKNAISKVKIICPEHGIFEQRANSHYSCGCPKCEHEKKGLKRRLKQKDLIKDFEKVHDNKYDYSKVKYVNRRIKIEIICKKHGSFFQRPLDHRGGYGCRKCNISKGEDKIRKILKLKKVKFESQYTFDDCKHISTLPFDFYLPEKNMCIEFDGEQHFRSVEFFGGKKAFKLTQKKDKIKNEYCKNNNIHLLRIKYNENIEEKLKESNI